MESWGGVARRKARWLSPKMMGAIPSARWGHSASYFHDSLYIFGGCRGGVHFSQLLVCNLPMATWTVLPTSGAGPGPRDSHSACVVGRCMYVFGGTDGLRKVGSLCVLDLATGEWSRPDCRGKPPPPREGHTVAVVGDRQLVVFGGSGEGEATYLNDLHFLDLATMEWWSPEVRGCVPPARDSHSSVAVGNKVYVIGGDSGESYRGDVWVLDVDNLLWSKVDAGGPCPGARAGHASVSIGTKVYVLGGVGEKQYFNDVWVLDVVICAWTRLDVACHNYCGGRFSHSATVTNMGIAVFGGCGEDERPLNELLMLLIDSPTSRDLGRKYGDDNEVFSNQADKKVEDGLHTQRKRRQSSNSNDMKRESESKQHSRSEPSSPSDANHVLTQIEGGIDNFCPNIHMSSDHPSRPKCSNLIGAEVHGRVDGSFDSGFLMTAIVNGRVLRGVLFAPGQDFDQRSGGTHDHCAHSRGLVDQNRAATTDSKAMELEGVVLTLASPWSI